MDGPVAPSFAAGAPLWLLAGMLSALVTVASIAYAQRRGLLDRPGRRRSHVHPTPRGGGVGIVLAMLLFGLLPLLLAGEVTSAWIAAALLAVALIGWIDDHGALSARLRLAVHLLAAVLLVGALGTRPGHPWLLPWLALLVLAVVWSINLHNFVDGINGLLALQATAILGWLAWFGHRAEDPVLGHFAAVGAFATLAFLPFNLPRARIFLGDVGSGALGLVIAAAALLALRSAALDLGAILMLCSACGIDASATLLSRLLRGRRWHQPHREHLYQWLVRSGSSHAQVAAGYFVWTAVLVPGLLALRAVAHASDWAQANPRLADSLYFIGWPAATLGIAALIWLAGKRACRHRLAKNRRPCVLRN